MRSPRRPLMALLALACLTPLDAHAVSRAEALTRARGYAEHPWRCEAVNTTASCDGGYQSINIPGDYVGLPYDWGGYVTLHQFDQAIAEGKGAGSQPGDGVLSCTVGVDCSGFVSRVWKAGHTTTSGMHTISHEIDPDDVQPADAFNVAGYHVILFEKTFASGQPSFIESVGVNVHRTFWETWTYIAGFTPIRYDDINDAAPAYTDGTADAPAVIDQFPFVDERDTTLSNSDLFDVCLGAAPAKGEYGPEVIYRVDLTQPGTLTATVQDDAGVDIDLHFYHALNETQCFARDDAMVQVQADCGSIWLVADSFTSATSGEDFPGAYTLSVDFEPSGAPCGPPTYPYAPGGAVGEACGYPDAPNLPLCNPNLGGVVCLYTSGPGATSFCTLPCLSDADCAQDFPGGCCAEVDVDLDACLTADFCQPVNPDPDLDPDPDPQPDLDPQPDTHPEVIDDTTPPDTITPDTDEPDTTTPGDDTGWTPSPDTATGPDGATGDDSAAPDSVAPAGDTTTGPGLDGVTGGGGGGDCAMSNEPSSSILALLLAALLLAMVRRQRRSLA